MYRCDVCVDNPAEALIVEQALAVYREMQRTANAAPDGHVLSQVEQLAVTRGREFIRKSLEAVLNEQAHEVEKNGASGRTCDCGRSRHHRGRQE